MKRFPQLQQSNEEGLVSSFPLQQQQVYATATYLAIAAIAATAAGTYVSYQGQKQAAQTQENVGKYNAKVQQNAAIQSDMEAREKIARERAANRRFMAGQRADLAKSGITFAGSPLEVLGETAGKLELQAQDEFRDSQNRLKAGMSGAANALVESDAQAGAYRTGSYGTLLSGVGSLAGSAYNYNSAGNFKTKGG